MSKKNKSNVNIWQKQWEIFSKNKSFHLNEGILLQIKKLFNQKVKNVKIIELGAGSGGDILYLTKLGAKTTALDFSPKSISIINSRAKKENVKITSICQDCTKTNISNNYFDLVYSVGLVEHFTNPLKTLKEQIRILKPGGYLIVDVPQKFNLYTLVKKIRMITGTYPFGWETEYSVFDLKNFGHLLGLKIVSFYGRDSAFTLKLPLSIQKTYKKMFSYIEKSRLAPYICLNLGFIYQKQIFKKNKRKSNY